MTDDNHASTAGAKNKGHRSGCFSILITLLLSLVGAYWFMTGEIILPRKAIIVTGPPARIVGLLWMAIWLIPPLSRLWARNREDSG